MTKIQSLLLMIAIALFSACQSKPSVETGTAAVKPVANEQICYSYTKNRDTANLMVIISGKIITGELNYRLYEKDKNRGVIKGEMKGDTLLADYSFNSEGTESVRQVAFLKKDGKLLEGFGDVIEKDGKTVFKNIAELKFGGVIDFDKTVCN